MNDQNVSELRPKRSSTILSYIKRFSATEKALFGIFSIALLISALAMASRVNAYFLTEIPATGGTLHEGMVGLPRTINPVLAVTDVDRDISYLVFSGLMKYEDGEFVPDLASKYTVSEDGLTYSFTLRDNIQFQDGTPLTADDIVFTIQKIQDPALKSPRRSDWANVTVSANSPHEVQFILKQAYSPFLANTTVGIIPKHIWSSVSDDQFIFDHHNIQPIGSGPYTVTDIIKDAGDIPSQYHLSTWHGYYDQPPYLSAFSLSFFADEAKALSALENGSIDSLSSLSATLASGLSKKTDGSYSIMTAPLPRIFGVFFNQNQNPVLADKTVRHALDISLDRKALVDSVLNGYGVPLYGPLPTTMSTSTIDLGTTSPISAAMAILEKDGWKKNPDGIYEKKTKTSSQSITFTIFTADTPDLKNAAEAVKKTWNELGADVSVKIFESSDLYQSVIRTRKYDALLFGEQVGKDRDLYAFWHSSQRNAPGLNVAMYTNSKTDKLLEDIRTTNDDVARSAKYAQFEDIVRAETPAVFLFSPDFIYVVPKRVRGITLGTVTVPSDRWNSIRDWYAVTEKVWKIFAKNKN